MKSVVRLVKFIQKYTEHGKKTISCRVYKYRFIRIQKTDKRYDHIKQLQTDHIITGNQTDKPFHKCQTDTSVDCFIIRIPADDHRNNRCRKNQETYFDKCALFQHKHIHLPCNNRRRDQYQKCRDQLPENPIDPAVIIFYKIPHIKILIHVVSFSL